VSYRELLAVPGGVALSGAGLIARMPISMQTLGTVLLVAAETGSYALAGAVSATVVAVQALVSPAASRLVDRVGQRRVMLPELVAHVAGLGALVAFVLAGAPAWTLFPAAAVFGGAYPPIGSLVRARWAHAVGGTPLLAVAYSVEAVVDEVIFIAGPVLVTMLAIRVAAWTGLFAAGLLATLGSVALALQRRSEPPGRPPDSGRHPSALRVPALRVLVLAGIAQGCIFGSFEVVAVAFTAERGQPGAAGLVLALLAGGSLVAGLWYGAVRWRAPLHRRMLVGSAALAAAVASFPLAPGVAGLAVLAFLGGTAVSPTMITVLALVEAHVPAAVRTEGLSWLLTGIGAGVGLASALAGQVVDAAGARAGFLVSLGAGLVSVTVGVTGSRWVRLDRTVPDVTVPHEVV
jgi:MFS family permease